MVEGLSAGLLCTPNTRMVALCIDGCRLSVHLSISSLTLSQEQNDIERKLKIGRKEAHDVGDL